MSEQERKPVGSIGWVDLTVENADAVRDFYREVVGWTPSGVSMGDYEDYMMADPATGAAIAGICHARGKNADIPPQWMIYVVVEDLDRSLARCRELGGEAVGEPRGAAGYGRFCLVRDPAGAHVMLFQQA